MYFLIIVLHTVLMPPMNSHPSITTILVVHYSYSFPLQTRFFCFSFISVIHFSSVRVID